MALLYGSIAAWNRSRHYSRLFLNYNWALHCPVFDHISQFSVILAALMIRIHVFFFWIRIRGSECGSAATWKLRIVITHTHVSTTFNYDQTYVATSEGNDPQTFLPLDIRTKIGRIVCPSTRRSDTATSKKGCSVAIAHYVPLAVVGKLLLKSSWVTLLQLLVKVTRYF